MSKPIKQTGVWQIGLLAGTPCFTDLDAIENLDGKASRPLTAFQDVEVRTKRKFPGERFKIGSKVKMTPMPQGKLYLMHNGRCFCTNAEEGRDFEF